MQIALPTSEADGTTARVSAHFGRTAGFTLYDSETGETDFVEHTGGHGPNASPPPVTVVETGADVVIAGNIGRGAVSRLRAADIEVFNGAEGSVEEAIAQWEAGELAAVEPGDVHGHDHGHGNGNGHGHDHDHGQGNGRQFTDR